MNALLIAHVGGGLVAILAGAIAIAARRGPVFALAGVCLMAGVLDLNAILHKKLTAAQRVSRHLWRMCWLVLSRPMEETFFAVRFGRLRDRFGTSWMILCPK